MTTKGFDRVWDFLPHFSLYQLGLVCGLSTMALNCGLWVLWSVFGFYRPAKYVIAPSWGIRSRAEDNQHLTIVSKVARFILSIDALAY